MGIINSSVNLASRINDKLPFTPQTKTVYDTLDKIGCLNYVPDVLSVEIDGVTKKKHKKKKDSIEEHGSSSMTLVDDHSATGSSSSSSTNTGVRGTDQIKQKLILARRVKTAINDEDRAFDAKSIMRHDDGLFKASASTGNGHIVKHHQNQEEEEIEAALSYLEKALTNERVKSDDELFNRFFTNAMAQLLNKVDFEPEMLFSGLQRNLKFKILQTYLEDDELVHEFRENFYSGGGMTTSQQYQHQRRGSSSINGGNASVTPPNGGQHSLSKKSSFSTSSSSSPQKRIHQRQRIKARPSLATIDSTVLAQSPYAIDSIAFKFIQFMILFFFKMCKMSFNIGLPFLELIWYQFLDLNYQYDLMIRFNGLIVSVFALIVDQLLQLVDLEQSHPGSEEDEEVIEPSYLGISQMIGNIVTNKVWDLMTLKKNKTKSTTTTAAVKTTKKKRTNSGITSPAYTNNTENLNNNYDDDDYYFEASSTPK